MIKLVLTICLLTNTIIASAQKTKTTAKKPMTTKKATTVKKVAVYIPTASDSLLVGEMAADMCGCIVPFVDSLHPIIKEYMMEMQEKSETVAKKNMEAKLKKATPADVEKVKADGMKMAGLGEDGGISSCMVTIEGKYKSKFEENMSPSKQKAMDKLLPYYLQKNKGCGILAMFFGK